MMIRCKRCGSKADVEFKIDMDSDTTIGACEAHKKEVKTAYQVLMISGEEPFNVFTSNWWFRKS